MKWLVQHIGELRFKRRLDRNASTVLAEAGVRTGQAVLDFGCGSSTYTIPAAKLVGEEGKVYALDISRKALDKMEKKAKQEGMRNIVRIDSSGDKEIPLEDATIDVMLLVDVLHNIDDRDTVLGEAHRMLKPGGILSIYPMHLTNEEVERLATNKGFTLENRKFQGSILMFRKTSQSW